jgi:hypothetical protein
MESMHEILETLPDPFNLEDSELNKKILTAVSTLWAVEDVSICVSNFHISSMYIYVFIYI